MEQRELIETISSSFAYERKAQNAAGKFWFEQYPEWLSPYAYLVIHRNERVLRLVSGGARMLDIGCGFGDMLFLLRDRYSEVHGVDPSAAMAKHAVENLQTRAANSRFHVKRGVAETLDYEDGFFDTVLMLDVYEHIRPTFRLQALREIRRIMKPCGELILVTPSRHILRFWNMLDNALMNPRRLSKGETLRFFRFESRPFTEEFCSKRELLDDLHVAGLQCLHVERVGFYPAAENPGFLEPVFRRTYGIRRVHRCLRALFRGIAALSFLNQKLLVKCRRTA